ncbi:MAG: pirin family protein [Thermoprotei archaeon]
MERTKTKGVGVVLRGRPTVEGAGVRLTRAFGSPDVVELFDPFLLLDDFGSNNPEDYIAGFPWHPHRGIETVTYMLEGEVEHEDSTGSKGVLGPGGVQWMTAGSGIIHSEMPRQKQSGVKGFQLWVNLPKRSKFIDPLYRDVKERSLPKVELEHGGWVRPVAGRIGDALGPVRDLAVDVEYLDVYLPKGASFSRSGEEGRNVFAYVIEGQGLFGSQTPEVVGEKRVVLFSKEGDRIQVKADDTPVRFLLVSGKPLHEPVAWYGPIVMNTYDEVRQALRDYQAGTFVKKPPEYTDAEE